MEAVCLPFVFLIAGTNLNESSISFCALLNPEGIGCVHCTGFDNESYPYWGVLPHARCLWINITKQG